MELTDHLFFEIYTLFLPRMQRIAQRYGASAHDAEDIAQNSMMKVLRGYAGFRGESSLATWITRITIHETYAYLRQSRRVIAWDDSYTPIYEADTAAPPTALHEWIQGLPPREAELIQLRYEHELSIAEIAERLQRKPSTVATLLQMAYDRLAHKLGKRPEELGQWW